MKSLDELAQDAIATVESEYYETVEIEGFFQRKE